MMFWAFRWNCRKKPTPILTSKVGSFSGGQCPPFMAKIIMVAGVTHPTQSMLTLEDIGFAAARTLLARYQLDLVQVENDQAIPGSFWGECEAGVIGSQVFARFDTPVHSLLHEACHLIVLPEEKRLEIHTDATDSVAEEDAVCVLQAILGDELPGVGRERIWADMDEWGYTFRLGSAKAYFENDANDSFNFLVTRGLINTKQQLL